MIVDCAVYEDGRLEREVLEMQRAVGPLARPVDRLARGHFDLVPPELRDSFRDVHDHVIRVTSPRASATCSAARSRRT